MKKNYYTIFNSSDEVIAFGLAEECSKQMNTNLRTFFSIISKNKRQRTTYKVVIEQVLINSKNQIEFDKD